MKLAAATLISLLATGSLWAGGLVDGTMETGITNAPVSPLTATHADMGWYASHSGMYSNHLGRIYRVPNVNNSSFRSVAQVVLNGKALAGSQPVVFDFDFAGATSAGNVTLSLFGWNTALAGAQVDIAGQDDNATGTSILLDKVDVGGNATANSGTYSNSVDLGAGYDYLVIAITIQYLGASGVGHIDNVRIGELVLPTRGTTFLIE
jgi:hypothetical protein